jgi:hypothetical protein
MAIQSTISHVAGTICMCHCDWLLSDYFWWFCI